jgi:protease-4
MFSSRRGFTADERQRLAAAIDAVYDDFVNKVADGRGRPSADIEAVARGRVWTGSDALQAGLVDEIGGLRDAVRVARERGHLPTDAPVRQPVHVPLLHRFGRARNSEDPRASLTGWPDLTSVSSAFGLSASAALLMPSIDIR